MEKSIEYLKEEISKLRGYAVIIDGEDGEWEPVTTVSIEDIYELINQLDKLEVLSQEWIDDNSVYASSDGITEEYVHVDDLKELLVPKHEVLSQEWIDKNQILVRNKIPFHMEVRYAVPSDVLSRVITPRQYVEEEQVQKYLSEHGIEVVEKPVIPQFVADFISDKEDWTVSELFDDEWLYKEHDQIAKWLYDNDDTVNRQREADLVFARKNGYTVEEEQKYYVMNNDNRMMLVRMMDGKTITESDPFMLEDMYEGEKESHRLTEQEIKDYDPRYWAFAKPVEELE